jgi:transposase-like protein
MLTKITVEAALNAKLDDHLGYIKHEPSDADNARNGYSSKTIQTEEGQFELDTPRDRAGSFNPRLVKNINDALTPWTTRLFSCMPRA